MSIKVKLTDIVDELEIQSEDSRSLLNIKTGEKLIVTSDDLRVAEDEEPFDHLPEWEQENRKVAIDDVENFENYISLQWSGPCTQPSKAKKWHVSQGQVAMLWLY